MASEKLFEEVPPFPDGVPIANVATISLASLGQNGEAADTAKRVLDACQKHGFFLLDLHGDPIVETFVREIDELFRVSTEIMDLPDKVKKEYQYKLPKGLLGFKPRGVGRVESGEPDRFEWFNLAQDSLFGLSPPQRVPEPALSSLALFASFLRHGQEIASIIFRSLAVSLSLPPSTFTDQHTLSKPSGTVIRCIRIPGFPSSSIPRASMIQHTDFGTLTLLANVVGGLQILQPPQAEEITAAGDDGWRYIQPRPGHLVVNLGDVMAEWTDGLLRSALHRVNHAPGQQSSVDRHSLGIFIRPERDARVKSLMRSMIRKSAGDGYDGHATGEEEALTVYEWEVRRAMALRKDEYGDQSQTWKAPPMPERAR